MADQLAIDGDKPALPEGPPDWPLLDQEITEVLARAAADGSWGRYLGPHCEALTQQIADYIELPHVRLYCSGTIAVEASLRAVGVKAGDHVLIAGYDFPGNFRAIESIGARPVVVDPKLENWSLTPAAFEQSVSFRPRAAIVSHLHGGLAPMRAIRAAADAAEIAIVEDACQSPGAQVDGRMAGTWGDVGVWSFGGSKLLTSGRGGALFTGDATIAQRAKLFSQRGNDAFPLSEIQAAILAPQLTKLDARNKQRAAAVAWLRGELADLGWLRPVDVGESDDRAAFYKLGFRIEAKTERVAALRNRLAEAARTEGIALDAGFRGFARRGAKRCEQVGDLGISRRLAEGTLVLHHPVLLAEDDHLAQLASAIRKLGQLADE